MTTNNASKDMRLFIACEVPRDVQTNISGVIDDLRNRSGNAVRWIRPDGAFVGVGEPRWAGSAAAAVRRLYPMTRSLWITSRAPRG